MDTDTHDGIAEALAALRAAGGGRAAEALAPGELVAVNAAFGALRRHVDAAFAPVAAEIARQSRVELGKDSLAKRQGFRSPTAMIQATTGSSVGEAIKLVQVGEATAPRATISGEALPARHPHVGAAVAAGRLGVTAASAIVSLLDRVALRVDAARLDAAEAELAAIAPGLRADELARVLARAEAHLDPDGIEPRHDAARANRSLSIHERDGQLHIQGVCDVATGAPIKAAIDALVTRTLRANERADDATRDDRSTRQMRLDALADLCAHALGCDAVPTAATTTVVVRIDLADLEARVGSATIDGFDTPIPAGAVRRLAAELQVIPCVLGGASEILDFGRARRLFSPAQKLALAERDGGCAFCGAPPAWTDGHHLDWWARGTAGTSLSNGVLLCTACHHRIHDDGWDITVEGIGVTARVWFIPPPWIDSDRTPRAGSPPRGALTLSSGVVSPRCDELTTSTVARVGA